MEKSTKIAMLGGDRRQLTVASSLAEHYDNIKIFGIDALYESEARGADFCDELSSALDGAKIIILPLPSSSDGVLLNCPLGEGAQRVKLASILSRADADAIVIGGRLPQSFCKSAGELGIRVVDYFESELFQVKNAYTTAEAAVSIAMNSLPKNIYRSRIAMTGFGRISKHLAIILLKLGAQVTVAARSSAQLAFAASLGCNTLVLDGEGKNILSLAHGFDVIYNTVPKWLIGRELLEIVDKNTIIIDLASAPGGVDIGAARELSSNVSWATSLPGKYAPQSAGELIFECIYDILENGGAPR